ncbi:hypothetical protein GH810_14365 [Acetobacterium paludosum]|uniref:Uncharacterized protein n=1 Tax=Acetobacterium paludosum TaxID=52693 RepID=A0A923I0L5_9FIRM|nr:hypothetical protein [Acetobacterium paludosum]MBC3889496.1 hypothetical protein [Acetobacterium paludosum]
MNYELIIMVQLVLILIAASVIIEKNQTIRAQKNEIAENEEYTTSWYGTAGREIIAEFERNLKRFRDDNCKLVEENYKLKRFNEVNRDYWGKLEQIYAEDHRLELPKEALNDRVQRSTNN